MRERVLKGYGRTTVTFEEDGKFYVQKGTAEGRLGAGTYASTYVEMNKKEYNSRLKKLARELASNPAVKLIDVIYDALKDYPLSFVEAYEKALARELKKKKPDVRTKPGHCCELIIGNYSFVLRT